MRFQMDVRTTSFAYPSQTRGTTRDVPLTRSFRRGTREKSRCVVRVAAPGDYGDEKTPSSEESSRQKLEVVTGLLREGYGVGAILTAAAFRGASVAAEILKGVTSGAAAARRRRAKPISRLTKKRIPSSMAERFQQAVAETMMTTSMPSEKTDAPAQHSMKCQMQSGDSSDTVNDQVMDQQFSSASKESNIESYVDDKTSSDPLSEASVDVDVWMMGYKEALGVPSEEPLSSRHIDRLEPSMWMHSAEKHSIGSELSPKAVLSEDIDLSEVDVVEDPVETAPSADVVFSQSPETDLMERPELLGESEHTDVAAGSTSGDTKEASADADMTATVTEPLSAGHRSNLEEIDAFIDASELAQGLEQFDAQEDATGLQEEKTIIDELESVDVLEDLVESDPISEMTPTDADLVDSPAQEDVHEDVILKNNVETFEKPSTETAPAEASPTAVNEALDILDKIATFEMEESVDEDDNNPLPQTVSVTAQKSKNEAEEEVRRQMQEESKRRLKAMKLQNEARQRRRHDAPVKVERPSSGHPFHSPGTSPPNQNLKGLDYIKSYAKEKQEHETEEASNESTSSFFKPPSILQDTKKQKSQTVTGPTRAYSQWNEIDRLKRVREIGTVMWLGKGGGGSDDGSGGSGGGGGGGGNSGKKGNPDDGHWWIQVRCQVK